MLRCNAISSDENGMSTFDLLLTDAQVATMAAGRYGVIDDAAVGIANGQISWVGSPIRTALTRRNQAPITGRPMANTCLDRLPYPSCLRRQSRG